LFQHHAVKLMTRFPFLHDYHIGPKLVKRSRLIFITGPDCENDFRIQVLNHTDNL